MQIDQKAYEAMYRTVMRMLTQEHPYAKVLFITVTKEEYAEYLALSWCRQLLELTACTEEKNTAGERTAPAEGE